MRKLLILTLFVCSLFGSEAEKMFWDEVKDTNDLEMLKLYKKRYPNGVFESLADLKIKRIKKAEKEDSKDGNEKPTWLKGYTKDYKFYGVGKANKHFKGVEHQESLAEKRATRDLINKLLGEKLTQNEIDELLTLSEKRKYINEKERIYILIYIDNDNL